MLLTLSLILVVMVSLAALEVWLFWWLGERAERRRSRQRGAARSSEGWTIRAQKRGSSPFHRPA